MGVVSDGANAVKYKIEHNIPIPAVKKVGRNGATDYRLREMAIGDSIAVKHRYVNSVSSAVSRLQARSRLQFTTRRTEAGVRIWRVE
jgi:hypothetical protein